MKPMESLVERIYRFMRQKGETVAGFSGRCGLANGTLNKARNGRTGLNSETLARILFANPDLSADWLFGREAGLAMDETLKGGLARDESPLRRLMEEIEQRLEALQGRVDQLEGKKPRT